MTLGSGPANPTVSTAHDGRVIVLDTNIVLDLFVFGADRGKRGPGNVGHEREVQFLIRVSMAITKRL